MAQTGAAADDRIDQLIRLTERLTERLAAETRAFEARNPAQVAATAEETARLANLYRHECTRLKAEPALVREAAEPKRRALMEATRAFEAVLARHGRALEAAKIVTEGLVQAIAEEVAETRATGAGYGPNAVGRQGDATSITLNRRA